MANIRETDAILHVLRCFDDDNITHVDGTVNPVRDKEIIDFELQLKDLETIESRISKVQKQAQTGGDKAAKVTYEVLSRYKEALEQGKAARTVTFETKDEQKIAHDLFLLTNKPVMYVCNVDDNSAVSGNKYVDMVREAVKDENAEILILAAKTESEIAEFETYEERQMFLQEIGLEESGVSRKVLSVPKSSNTTTISLSVPKTLVKRPVKCTSKEKNMSYKTATSCTSDSTYNLHSHYPTKKCDENSSHFLYPPSRRVNAFPIDSKSRHSGIYCPKYDKPPLNLYRF